MSDALDADDALATLVSFATEGNVDGLADLITDSGWCRQVGIFRRFMPLELHTPVRIPDILLVIDEVTTTTLKDGVLGCRCSVRALGADGARMVLEKRRDDYGNGEEVHDAQCGLAP